MAAGGEMETPLPFFVYGTLRKGGANSHLWGRQGVTFQPAVLSGAQLWDLGPYPMAIPAPEAIWGELVAVEAAQYSRLLAALDRLEGVDPRDPFSHRGLFRRARCLAHIPVGGNSLDGRAWWPRSAQPIEAWVYWGRPETARRGYQIRSGDWFERRGDAPE